MVKVISFDVGGTLIDTEKGFMQNILKKKRKSIRGLILSLLTRPIRESERISFRFFYEAIAPRLSSRLKTTSRERPTVEPQRGINAIMVSAAHQVNTRSVQMNIVPIPDVVRMVILCLEVTPALSVRREQKQ